MLRKLTVYASTSPLTNRCPCCTYHRRPAPLSSSYTPIVIEYLHPAELLHNGRPNHDAASRRPRVLLITPLRLQHPSRARCTLCSSKSVRTAARRVPPRPPIAVVSPFIIAPRCMRLLTYRTPGQCHSSNAGLSRDPVWAQTRPSKPQDEHHPENERERLQLIWVRLQRALGVVPRHQPR